MMELKGSNSKKYIIMTALLTFCAALLALLPAVIMGRGMLLMTDDFTYQQQTFNIYYKDLYKNLANFTGWSWFTDLGSNAIASFSFYNLASPFTWIIVLFPAKVIPYLTYPMLALKYAVAGVGAYLYLAKKVKKQTSAVFGALLYAFCGLQTVNLIFPFHDATAIFPLLLLATDECDSLKKSWKLVLAAFFAAVTNYFLFFGEVVFLIIYWLITYVKTDGAWKRLFSCIAAGLIGVALACPVLLPSLKAVIGNPRVGSHCNEIRFAMTGYVTLLWAYFMPTDVMGMRNATYQHTCSSCSVWLPAVGMALVFAYVIRKGFRDRKSILSITCVFISLVPVLNSVFSFFNSNYYCRWFYMPALVFALMSAEALDDDNGRSYLKKGSFCNIIMVVLTAVLTFALHFYYVLRGVQSEVKYVNTKVAAIYAIYGILFAVATFFIVRIRKNETMTKALITVVLAGAIIVTGAAAVRYSMGVQPTEHYEAGVVNSEGQIGAREAKEMLTSFSEIAGNLPIDSNYRIRTDWHDEGENYFANSYDNISMLLKIPSVNSFISTVSGGIFEFYDTLGTGRNVTTVGDFNDDLMLLLSARYYLCETPDGAPVASYRFKTGKTVYVCEYEDFLPMGFAYESYVTPDELAEIEPALRARAMLENIVLEAPAAERLGLKHNVGKTDVLDRAKSVEFTRTSKGFTSKIIAKDSEKVAFFSVPYDKAWTCTVNGKKVEILSTAGLMAVPVSEGENKIVFRYN